MGAQCAKARRGFPHDGTIECLEQPPRLVTKAPELRVGFRPGEIPDGLRAQFRVGVKVERRAIAPEVPREDRVGMKSDMVRQSFPDLRKQVFEHVPHRHDGWPDVDRPCRGLARPHLAAGSRRHVDDIDRQTTMRQPKRGGQTAYSGTDDDDPSCLGLSAVWHEICS
jgi:hypothetical protein